MTQIEVIDLPAGSDTDVVPLECPDGDGFAIKFPAEYTVVTTTSEGIIMALRSAGAPHRWRPSKPCQVISSKNGVVTFSTGKERSAEKMVKALTASLMGMLQVQKQILSEIKELREQVGNLASEAELKEAADQTGSS